MTETAPLQPPRRAGVLARVALWCAAGVAAMAAVIVVLAPAAIEWVASRTLTARGLGPATLNVVHASFSGFEARDISMAGGAARIGRVRIDYRITDLLSGRIAGLRIENADVTVSWDGTALRLGQAELRVPPRRDSPATEGARPDATSPGASRPPPLRSIALVNAQIRFALPDRVLDSVSSLELSHAGANLWRGRVDIGVSGDAIAGRLDWNGIIAGADLAAWRGDGALRVAIDGLTVADAVTDLSVDLDIAVDADEATTRVTGRFDRPLSLALAPTLADALDAALPGSAGARQASLVVLGRTGAPFAVVREVVNGADRWSTDVAVEAALGRTRARVVIDGWFGAQDLAYPLISAQVSDLPYAGGTVNAAISLTDNAGPLVMAGGAFALDATGRGIASDTFILPGGQLTGRGTWRLDGLALSFEFDDLALTVNDAAPTPAITLPGAQTVTLAPASPRGQVNVVFGNEMSIAADLDVAVPLSARAGDAAQLIALDLPRLGISGYVTPGDGRYRVRFSGNTGKLAYGKAAALLPDFDLTAADGAIAGRVDGRLVAAGAESASGALANRPDTSLAFRAMVQTRARAIEVSGQLLTATENPLGTFSGRRAEDGQLELTVDVPELAIGAGATPWDDVAGSLLPIDRAEGRIAVALRARPGPTGIDGSARLTLDGFSFDYGTVRVRDLACALALDQIWPPRAPTAQSLSFSALDISPPLTAGRLVVALPGDGTAVLEQFRADLAGGRITGGPAVVHLDGRPSMLTLSVNEARVDRLLAAATTDGLTGTGTISGLIPLHLRDGGLYVEQATLAGQNGSVAYRPAVAPAALASGGELVLQALTDFRFDEVRADINGNALEDLTVAIKLKGKNPGLYGGYPIEFNLNLDGPLARIATDSLAGYRIPDEIRQRVEQDAIEHKAVSGGGAAATPP